jgi:hypothetical protein
MTVDELNRRQLLIDRTACQLPLHDRMMEKVTHLLLGDLIGRSTIVAGPLLHGFDVALYRVGGLAVKLEFTNHLLTQGSHVVAP